MRIRFLRLRALQLSLCLCCLSSATNAIAQIAQGGVAPGRSYSAPASSTLLSSSIATTCTIADTNTTDLWTFNLPANTLNEDGKTVRITAWGTTAANANNKTEQATFGGTVIATRGPNADSGFSWVLRADVMRTGASAQLAHGNSEAATTGAVAAYVLRTTTIAADNTQAIPLKVTGLNGTASAGDVCVNAVFVELIQSNTNNIVTSTGGPVANPILLPNGVAAAPALGFASEPALGFYRSGSNSLVFSTTSGTDVFRISNIGPIVNSSSTLSWGSTGISGPDTFLNRDGANILALRNGVTAQSFKLYNTFTDASNFERGGFVWSGNELRISTEAAGTGTARNVLIFPSNGGTGWRFTTTGLVTSNDNTVDIGASGATRPRSMYLGTSLNVGSNFSVSSGGTITTTGGSGINFSSASRIQSAADGNITLYNQAITDFSLLQFGGTSNLFPALRRSGSTLLVRLADDSAAGALQGNLIVGTGNVLSTLATGSSAPLIAGTAPTISSGFGTTPTIANNNGTAAFTVNVGTGGTATSGVVGLPTATNGWNCFVQDITAQAAHTADRETRQVASTTTSATFENQIVSTGATVGAPWAANDILRISCFAF